MRKGTAGTAASYACLRTATRSPDARVVRLHAAMPTCSSRSISGCALSEDRWRGRGSRAFAALAVFVLATVGAGCTVGPDFKRPEPPATPSYKAEPVPPSTAETAIAGGGSQRFVV